MPSPSVTPPKHSEDADWLRQRLRRHVTEMLRLAPGIVLARSGIVIMILVDTIIVGRHSAVELGYFAIGNSIVQPIIVTSLGLILGTLVLTANHFGAGDWAECGAVWRRSVVYAAGLGAVGLAICLFGGWILIMTGQTEQLATEGGRVIRIIGWGLPAHLVFLASSFFLEGIARVGPGAVCMVIANVVNFVLALMLVDGFGLIAPMGAEGAAWATTAARWVLAIGMLGYVILMRDQVAFSVRTAPLGRFTTWRHQRRLGYAMGLSLAVETFAFSIMQQFAGWLGTAELAAFAIAFQLLTISFMVAVGIGSATAVRVGIAYGRGDVRDVVLAAWMGLGLSMIANALIGIGIILFANSITGAFTHDAAVLAMAMPLIFWVAIALVTDGGQAVIANALRGRQDVWAACVIQAVAFLGVMVPLTWFLAFPAGNGAAGLFQGVLIGATVSIFMLGWRLHQLYVRDTRAPS
jgi:MATE family multidrug resistance protein